MTDAIVSENEKAAGPERPASSPVLSTRTFSHLDNEETEGDEDGEDFSDVEEKEVFEIVQHLRVNINSHNQKPQQKHHFKNHHYQDHPRRRRQKRGSESKPKADQFSPVPTPSDSTNIMTSTTFSTTATTFTTTTTTTPTTSSSNYTSHNHHSHQLNNHHHQQPLSASSTASTASSKSVALPPLTANDSLQQNLKNQFLLGSTTFFDSFFGQDELDRFFPDHKLRLAVVTWNMSSKPPAAVSTTNEGGNNLEANSSYQRTLRSILMPKYPGSNSNSRYTDDINQRLPELFVIGLQETPKSEVVVGQLKVALQAALGPNYALLQWSAVGVLHASIWLRRELLWSCTAVDTVPIHSRPTAANRIRTKGAVALSFSLFGTAFLFINTHLSAHETNLRTRINQLDKVQQILNLKLSAAGISKNQDLQTNTTFNSYVARTQQEANNVSTDESIETKPNNGEIVVENLEKRNDEQKSKSVPNGPSSKPSFKTDQTHHSEYVFWFGDLNFRLELPQESVQTAIKQIATAPNSEERLLHQHRLMRSDQLTNLMARGMIFDGFREAIWPPPFLPTYKCKMRSSKAVNSYSLPRLKNKKKEIKDSIPSVHHPVSTQEAVIINQSESQSNSSNYSSPSSQSVESSVSSITVSNINSPVISPTVSTSKKPVTNSTTLTPPTVNRSSSRSVPLNLNSLTDEEEEDEEDENVISSSFNTTRVPSFTDRILYQARFATENSSNGNSGIDLTDNGAIRCLAYTAIRSVDSSDHKPVRALFEVDLDAGGPRVPLRLKKPIHHHASIFFGDRERMDEFKPKIRGVPEYGSVLSSSSSEQVLSTAVQTTTTNQQELLTSKDKQSTANISSFFGRRLGKKGRQKRKEFKLQQQHERLLHGSVSMSSLPTAAAALSASLDSKLTRLNAGAFERQVFIDGLRLRNSLVSNNTNVHNDARETSLPTERHSKFKFGIGNSNNVVNSRANALKRSLYKSRSFDSNVETPQIVASTSVVITPPPPPLASVVVSSPRRQRPHSEGPVPFTSKTSSSTLSTGNIETDSESGITSANSVATSFTSNNKNTRQPNQENLSKSSSICSIA